MYFETHAHYNDERYKDDQKEVIEKMIAAKVKYILNVSASMESSKTTMDLIEKYDFIFGGVGVHPHSVEHLTESHMDILKEYTKHEKIVAIGEIGLDYYYDNSSRDIQKKWFKRQLKLADEVNLPVSIHSRDAEQECFDILKEANIKRKGIIHCYTGSKEMALEYIKIGYLIGIGGVVTFQNANKIIDTVTHIPIESIVLETDAPYLTPHPKRGKRNDSTNLYYIAEKVAEIKNMSFEDVLRITMKSAVDLFL